MKKSQTATEYLIILAVVIIIAIIVVGVLGGIPNIGGRTSERGASTILQSLDIGIQSQTVSNSTARLTLRNNVGSTVTINSVNLSSAGASRGNCPQNTILTSGESSVFTCTNMGLTAGQRYELDVSITYIVQTTGVEYVQSGKAKITGTVGTS